MSSHLWPFSYMKLYTFIGNSSSFTGLGPTGRDVDSQVNVLTSLTLLIHLLATHRNSSSFTALGPTGLDVGSQLNVLTSLTQGQKCPHIPDPGQVSSLSRGKSRHPMRNSGPFFVIRLSFTSRTKNSVYLLFDFSKGFLQVRVAWDFSLTDFSPACQGTTLINYQLRTLGYQ